MESVLYKRHPTHRHLFCGSNGHIWSTRGNVFLLSKNREGRSYPDMGKNNKIFGYRLCWEAHIGPIPNGMEVNHINGDCADDRLANLEVVTHAENMKHASINKLFGCRKGVNNSKVKLTEKQVIEILNRKEISMAKLGKEYGVSTSCISSIKYGKNWSYLNRVLPDS